MTATALSGRKYSVYPEYKESGVEWLGIVPSHPIGRLVNSKMYCELKMEKIISM